jgi:ParB/RepB/Spo0J family partition protein
MVKLGNLDLLPFQSRLNIEGLEFEALVQSVKENGVLEPLLVRQKGERFEVMAGGRRMRAAQCAGLAEVPCVVEVADDERAMDIHFIENLHRADLTDEEKRTSLGNYARIRKLNAKQIVERLHVNYSWVIKYLPSEFKDEKMAALGQKGGEAKAEAVATRRVAEAQTVKTQDMQICEVHGTASSDTDFITILGKPRRLCGRCRLDYPNNTLRYESHFRHLNGESKTLEERLKPKYESAYKETAEYRKAQMSPQKSKAEEAIVQGLRAEGFKVTIDQVVYVVPTIPDAIIELASERMAYIYVDGVDVHTGKQKDKDDSLRKWLQLKEPNSLIIPVDVQNGSPQEIAEKIVEIKESLKWAK